MARAIRMLVRFVLTVFLVIGIALFLSVSYSLAWAMRKYVPAPATSPKDSPDVLAD